MDNTNQNERTFALLQQILNIMERTLRQSEIENRNANLNRNGMQNVNRVRYNQPNIRIDRHQHPNRRHNKK